MACLKVSAAGLILFITLAHCWNVDVKVNDIDDDLYQSTPNPGEFARELATGQPGPLLPTRPGSGLGPVNEARCSTSYTFGNRTTGEY